MRSVFPAGGNHGLGAAKSYQVYDIEGLGAPNTQLLVLNGLRSYA